MTNQEVLEKAISKAIEGGWKPWVVPLDTNLPTPNWPKRAMEVFNWAEVIFNKEFAKALWGDEPEHYADEYEPTSGGQLHWHHWEYMLAEMVIADDPIAYLGEHLDG